MDLPATTTPLDHHDVVAVIQPACPATAPTPVNCGGGDCDRARRRVPRSLATTTVAAAAASTGGA